MTMNTVDPPSDATNPSSSQSPAAMPELDGPAVGEGDAPVDPAHAVDMLGDVDLDVKVELGRCRMLVGDVLRLSSGSVVELDKLAGDPVDVYVNERLVARGEVLVVNDNFCVRVNEVLSDED
ncbi:MAG: flagellar motor switch protein FliN [Planctomycetes bacterium]|nr:flagellar motor switch protein FliN [Planctomycetota bacterium]